jgi:hypothetical protein
MISGVEVIPMTVMGQYMIQTVMDLFPGHQLMCAQNVKVFAGLKVTKDINLDTRVKWVESTGDEHTFDVKVFCDNKPAYGSQIVLGSTKPTHPAISDLDNLNQVKTSDVYNTRESLFHGPIFQMIDHVISVDDKEILVQISVNDTKSHQGQFVSWGEIDAITLDAAYQSVLIFVESKYGKKSIPLYGGEQRYYSAMPPTNEKIYIKVTETKHENNTVYVAICLFDKNGRVITRVTGTTVSMY